MAAKKPAMKAPAKVGATTGAKSIRRVIAEDRRWHREYLLQQTRLIDAYGTAVTRKDGEAYVAALKELAAAVPAATRIVFAEIERLEAAVDNILDAALDALNAECERRELAPEKARVVTAYRAAKARSAEPKRTAMAAIMEAWEAMQAGNSNFQKDSEFARSKSIEFGGLVAEGTIKNAISKRRKGQSSS